MKAGSESCLPLTHADKGTTPAEAGAQLGDGGNGGPS